MYQFKEVAPQRFLLSLDNHTEIMEAVSAFCREKGILAGIIGGIGAVSEATFRFLDPATKQYVDKTFKEQMEITSQSGNISRRPDDPQSPYLHIHVTAGRRDYTCIGGHLLSARINGACELYVDAFDAEAGRRFDPESGLNLYKF